MKWYYIIENWVNILSRAPILMSQWFTALFNYIMRMCESIFCAWCTSLLLHSSYLLFFMPTLSWSTEELVLTWKSVLWLPGIEGRITRIFWGPSCICGQPLLLVKKLWNLWFCHLATLCSERMCPYHHSCCQLQSCRASVFPCPFLVSSSANSGSAWQCWTVLYSPIEP